MSFCEAIEVLLAKSKIVIEPKKKIGYIKSYISSRPLTVGG